MLMRQNSEADAKAKLAADAVKKPADADESQIQKLMPKRTSADAKASW
jgi:hypothetical protein